MGHRLAQKSKQCGLRGIGCILYVEEQMEDKTKYKVSLRSVAEEDTAILSQYFGGGGHKNASSFAISKQLADKWKCP